MFNWFNKKAAPQVADQVQTKKRGSWKRLHEKTVAMISNAPKNGQEIAPYTPAPGVIPKEEQDAAMAMDSIPYEYVNAGVGVNHLFMGYPYLATLAQKPEYRIMVSTLAEEMTRKWIKIESTSKGDVTERIDKINKAMERYKVKEAFRQMIEHDLYFGRGQIYIELKGQGGGYVSDDKDELETLLTISPAKIGKGSLVTFRNVEPIWMYPKEYNSSNPLRSDYYDPKTWYVMGKTVHSSRMLMVISNPVPDIYKPSYSFGGISLVQMAEDYVNNWISARDSIKDMIKSFSISGIKTNMATILNGEEDDDILKRLELFNLFRDNRGVFALDKGEEEFFQFNTPLSGLEGLQAQAKENMSLISGIPLVKLLGITPSGLNASSDGEIRVFYDGIAAKQEANLRDNIKKVIDIIQLSEFGDIDESITFSFEPLFQLSELEHAQVRNMDADTDCKYADSQILLDAEVREKIKSDPRNPYQSLDPSVITDEEKDPDA